MAEYIEREAAIAVINKLKGPTRSPAQNNMILEALTNMARVPAADVEPVVRCKECKYWCEAALRCNHPDCKYSFERYFTGDCFCSFGERRNKSWRDAKRA